MINRSLTIGNVRPQRDHGQRGERLATVPAYSARRGKHMRSAFGPKQTLLVRRTCLLAGVKRTWPFAEVRFCGRYRGQSIATHMSAYDPKRTPVRPMIAPSRAPVQIATIACLSLEGDYEATPVHHIIWRCGGLLAAGFARAAGGADAEHRRAHAFARRPSGCPGTSRGISPDFEAIGLDRRW